MHMKNYLWVVVSLISIKGVCGQTFVDTKFSVKPNTTLSVKDKLINTSNGSILNDGIMSLFSDVENNGAFMYSNDQLTGRVNFYGAVQHIEGSSTVFFNHVAFNNEETNVFSTIQIDGDATFQLGIINSDEDLPKVFFGELSDHSEASDFSHVNGSVVKIGEQSFEYPIGDGEYYRSNGLSGLSSSNQISSAYLGENSDFVFPHSQKSYNIDFIDDTEYWQISQVSGNEYGIIELTLNANTSPNAIMDSDINNIHIIRWDDTAEKWVDEGGVPKDNVSNTIITISKTSGYGVYTLASSVRKTTEIKVFNLITPNGDGINDKLIIEGIEKFPDNMVKIFNRWGSLIYEVNGYNNEEKSFDGFFNDEKIPDGTYFYIVEYIGEDGPVKIIKYLYVNE